MTQITNKDTKTAATGNDTIQIVIPWREFDETLVKGDQIIVKYSNGATKEVSFSYDWYTGDYTNNYQAKWKYLDEG